MKFGDSSGPHSPEVCLELCEGHLDRIEVRAIRWQEEEAGPTHSEDILCFFTFVAGQIVENDDVTGTECRGELGFHIGLENVSVHWRIDDPRGGQAITTERRDEGLDFPVSERSLSFQALAPPGSSTQPGHFGRCRRFVEKDKPLWLLAQVRLPMGTPEPAFIAEFSAFALRCQKRFF